MVEFIWKERVMKKRHLELRKRGVELATDSLDAKARLDAVSDRGGIVNPVKAEDVGVEVVSEKKVIEGPIGSD